MHKLDQRKDFVTSRLMVERKALFGLMMIFCTHFLPKSRITKWARYETSFRAFLYTMIATFWPMRGHKSLASDQSEAELRSLDSPVAGRWWESACFEIQFQPGPAWWSSQSFWCCNKEILTLSIQNHLLFQLFSVSLCFNILFPIYI